MVLSLALFAFVIIFFYQGGKLLARSSLYKKLNEAMIICTTIVTTVIIFKNAIGTDFIHITLMELITFGLLGITLKIKSLPVCTFIIMMLLATSITFCFNN